MYSVCHLKNNFIEDNKLKRKTILVMPQLGLKKIHYKNERNTCE